MLLKEFVSRYPDIPPKDGMVSVLKEQYDRSHWIFGGLTWPVYVRKSDAYISLLEYFRGDVPDEIDRAFLDKEAWDRDFILENLQTHDNQKLVDALEAYFGENFYSAEKARGRDLDAIWITLRGTRNSPLDFVHKRLEQEFADLKRSGKQSDLVRVIQWYGYYWSELECKGFVRLLIEPVYSERLGPPAEGHYRTLYHVCSRTAVPNILKTGLRTKWGPTWERVGGDGSRGSGWRRVGREGMYRYFPQRVHLFAFDSKSSAERNKEFKRFLATLERDEKEIAVFKVELPGFVNLYRDTGMPEDNSYYCYNSIPPEYLKLIYPKELKESSLKIVNLALGR